MSETIGRLLDAASRGCERLGRILMYASLGTRRLADLRRGSDRTWQTYNVHEADIDAGFYHWERLVVERFVRPADRVLVIGCGTGRDLVAFARIGCAVTGIEPIASARAVAEQALRDRDLSGVVVPGYVEEWPVAGEFDVISLLSCPFSYIPGSDRRVAMLRGACAHLTPGGRIALAFLPSSNAGVRSERSLAIGRWVGRLCRTDWHIASGDAFLRVHDQPLTFTYEHYFTVDELTREAGRAGLRVAFHDRPASVLVLTR